MKNIFLISSNLDLKCTHTPLFWDNKKVPNIAHLLQKFHKLIVDELLLQNIHVSGKVTPGCSQQFILRKTIEGY